jgi:hypothetical protein
MAELLMHVALIAESSNVTLEALSIVAAALQKQVSRDFGPIWDVNATVDAFPKLEDVPIDYWKVIIMDDIGQPGAAGVHMDDQGQPFALVTTDPSQDVWSLTASHECLEMLADPFGNRLLAGDSPMEGQGRVQILVEVSDPSEDATFGYSVNGVLVSDFYTPHFFDPIAANSVRYSFTGSITEPRQVLKGGYLSWVDPQTNDWWQKTWFSGNAASFRKLGPLSSKAGSFRAQIDAVTSKQTKAATARGRKVAMAAGQTTAVTSLSSIARAEGLRQCIQDLIAEGGQIAGAMRKPQARRIPRVRSEE